MVLPITAVAVIGEDPNLIKNYGSQIERISFHSFYILSFEKLKWTTKSTSMGAIIKALPMDSGILMFLLYFFW